MKQLIINADDFGKFKKINEGIVAGIEKGAITSTSVLIYGKYSNEAKFLLKYRNVSVGLHFEKRYEAEEDLVRDFSYQVEHFCSIVGKKPDHIDFHKISNIEEYPCLSDCVKRYSRDKRIPVRREGFANFISGFFAMSQQDYKTIDLNKVSPESLMKILDSQLVDGPNELMCHAGWVDQEVQENSSYWVAREVELNTLLSREVKDYIARKGIRLISWKDVEVTDK